MWIRHSQSWGGLCNLPWYKPRVLGSRDHRSERMVLARLENYRALFWLFLATLLWNGVGYCQRGSELALPLALAATPLFFGLLFTQKGSILKRLIPTPKAVIIGILEGGLLCASTYLLFPLFIALFDFAQSDIQSLYAQLGQGPQGWALLLLLLYVILIEEVIWREIGLNAKLFGVQNPHFRVGIMVVLYALAQIGGGTRMLVILAVSYGTVWGYQRILHRSLVVPLVSHWVWDYVVMIKWPLPMIYPDLFVD